VRAILALLFRSALALCPPGFRREYGAAMLDDFARACAEERSVHGTVGAVTYALGASGDLFTTALREYAAMFFRDFSYALRALRKTPSFTAVVVATLALAIGANAAVFSVLHAVVLAPLPYSDPDRLVALEVLEKGKQSNNSLPDYADTVRQAGTVFVSSASFQNTMNTVTGRGEPRTYQGVLATPRLFETLGVRPELGRFPTAHDAVRGTAKIVVISDTLWRSTFGADPNAIGSSVRIDGDSYRLIGVVPANFRQPRPGPQGFVLADIWTFLPENGAGTQYDRGYRSFSEIARLRPGVPIASAQAAVDAAYSGLVRRYPSDDTGYAVHVESLADSLVGNVRALLFAMFAAVGAVLLVACANVANLLLSRAASREREFSVRIAIGASRGRIIAQLLVETFVLALAGGACGIALAYGAVAAFVAFHPPNIPRADLVTVDGASILYTLGVVAFCTLAAGLAPAFTSSQRDVAVALKSAGRGGDAHRGARARNILVACEIAMTLALVVGAGLVVRSFIALTGQPLGFEANLVTTVGGIDLPDSRYGADAAREAMMTRMVAKVRSVPGVERVAWAFSAPFTHYNFGTTFTIPGHPVRPGYEPSASIDPVGPDYFRILHATMLGGRTFTDDDRTGSLRVAIVNQTFVREYFGGRTPIGLQIVPGISLAADKTPPNRTIVGVVADLRSSFTKPAAPEIYIPARQLPIGGSTLVVATEPGTDPTADVAAAVVSLDPLLPKPAVVSLPVLLRQSVAVQQLSVAALCALAFVALALSIAGIFAVVSYGVTQRTHEFGVRMALGADARQIVRMVIGGAMRLAFVGIAIGLLVAGAGTRLLSDQLFDTQPLDPLTFASVTLLVIAAALVAALVPARRATRVDPIVALRYE
jgi:putative ABC transport system permease protein